VKSVEDLLAKMARAGNFSHLSIHGEWKTGIFTASLRDVDGGPLIVESDKDIVLALRKALMRSKVHRPAPAAAPKKRLMLDEDIP
jgi:hypothetical protein